MKTLVGTTIELPFANEHPCFGQRQDWCKNMATWRIESQYLLLHFCDECKQKPQAQFEGGKWIKLGPR